MTFPDPKKPARGARRLPRRALGRDVRLRAAARRHDPRDRERARREGPLRRRVAPAEIERLKAWVEAGGALFLIADHAPFGSAAHGLAAAFGVETIDGHVRDEAHAATELPGPYFLEFTRANGLLGDHP